MNSYSLGRLDAFEFVQLCGHHAGVLQRVFSYLLQVFSVLLKLGLLRLELPLVPSQLRICLNAQIAFLAGPSAHLLPKVFRFSQLLI